MIYETMKRFLIIASSLCIVITCLAQESRALLIGIENYPKDSGWQTICAHNDLACIRSALINNGFLSENIMELRDEKATLFNIRRSLHSLSKKAQKGDNIIIFFSCHGQLITDINGDEEDGFDEALIPYDACSEYGRNGYKGEKHLIDDEVNSLLAEIHNSVGEKGHLLALFDSCHSGDVDRAPNQLIRSGNYRGIDKSFIIPNVAPKKNDRKQEERTWTSISACLDYQTNYEIVVNGKRFGRLAYSFSKVWSSEISDKMLINALSQVYSSYPRTDGGFYQELDSYIYEGN